MVQMIVQHDAAAATVEALGEVGSIMFVDLNEGVTTFQRNFVNDVKTCDKMERDLSQIGTAITAAGFTAGPEGPPLPHNQSTSELQRVLEETAKDLKQLKDEMSEAQKDKDTRAFGIGVGSGGGKYSSQAADRDGAALEEEEEAEEKTKTKKSRR